MSGRLRSAVGRALRRRLVPEPDPVLPPFPSEGVLGRGCMLACYRDEDAPARLELEHSEGMLMWRSAFADPMMTPEQALSWCRSQQAQARSGRLPASYAILSRGNHAPPVYAGDITVRQAVGGFAAVEVSIALLPRMRGRQLAIPASYAVLHWLTAVEGLHRIEVAHSVKNRVVCVLADTVGLPREGTKRQAFPVKNANGDIEWHDACSHAGLTAELRRSLPAAVTD